MREDIQARFESVTALQKEQNSEVALMLDQWRKEMKHIFNDTNKQSNHTTLLKVNTFILCSFHSFLYINIFSPSFSPSLFIQGYK